MSICTFHYFLFCNVAAGYLQAIASTSASPSPAVQHAKNETAGAMAGVLERARLVAERCESSPSYDDVTSACWSTAFFLQSVLSDRRNEVAYCAIPKVASSTVKTAMVAATGRLPATELRHLESLPVHSRKFMSHVGLRTAHSLAR